MDGFLNLFLPVGTIVLTDDHTCTGGKAAEEANQKIVVLSIKDPTARVARFLIFHDSRAHGQEIHMKLEDMANAISLRPETISRSIAVLARKKLIARTGQGRIRVIDSVGLAEISRDSKE